MSGFKKWAVTSRLHDGSGKFKLMLDLTYTTLVGTVYTVPRGFQTDFASTPRILWSIFPPHGLYLSAAILHDYFCESDWISRKDGDDLFLEAMGQSHVGKITKILIYGAVRLFAIIMRVK